MALGIFHAVIAVARGHRLEARAQEGDVAIAPDETHMRAGVKESPGVGDGAFLDEIGPKLSGEIELRVDLERLGDVDAPVGTLRRVIQLAIGRVAGACVVP